MRLFSIDEMKYSVESRLSGVTPSTKNFFNKFNEGMSIISETLKTEIAAKTHIRGLSYFITPTRAFIFLNIRQNFLSLIFYTGKEKIIGLPKANWIRGEDACGSITFRIEDNRSLAKALTFARQSCEIALNTLGEHTRHKGLTSNAQQCNERPMPPSTDYHIRLKDSKDSEAIKLHTARQIILHAVSATKRRWSQYDQSWNDIDRIFIQHGYEQGGFQIFKMVPLLEDRGIYSIKSLGSILSNYARPKKYDRNYAGSLDSEFYTKLKAGKLGRIGLLFYECTNIFLTEKVGNPGAFFWKMIWQLLISCNFLRCEYNSSFSEYIRSKYAEFVEENNFSDRQFLDISDEGWHVFLGKVKPWRPLYGIGQNVFDFIFGDIVEARFVNDSYKFDSANQHFCRVTGIDDLIRPFDRDNTIQFLKTLGLPYTLREINKGIYTYCSKTEEVNFGFCRSKDKCFDCGVENLCKHRIKG